MSQTPRILTQCCTNKQHLGIVLALFVLVVGSCRIAQAGTISFTFSISADASTVGTPSSTTLSLPTTIVGSGSFVPFGTAVYSEAGTVTYVMLPSGAFVPSSVMNDFTASFNGGTNTFTGTNAVKFGAPNAMGLPTFSSNLAILSGTGIFSGANGSATATGAATALPATGQPTPISFSGSGQITAPGLAAIPEPATIALLGTSMVGVAGLAAIRKKRRGSIAN